MRKNILLTVALLAGIAFSSPLLGAEPATTSELPAALKALGPTPSNVLTSEEAGRIRGAGFKNPAGNFRGYKPGGGFKNPAGNFKGYKPGR